MKRRPKRRERGWGETVNTFLVQTCGRNSVLPECEGAEGFSLLPTGKMPQTKKEGASRHLCTPSTLPRATAAAPGCSLSDVLEVFDEVIAVQCADGNWNFDPYMHGMANGMIYMRSLLSREDPQFLEAPDVWISERQAGRTMGVAREWNVVRRTAPDPTRGEAPHRRRRRRSIFKKERRNPNPPDTVVDVIVETCGRNYYPEECRDYEEGFRWAVAEAKRAVEESFQEVVW